MMTIEKAPTIYSKQNYCFNEQLCKEFSREGISGNTLRRRNGHGHLLISLKRRTLCKDKGKHSNHKAEIFFILSILNDSFWQNLPFLKFQGGSDG